MSKELRTSISSGDVVIGVPDQAKNVGIRISGGADSAMLAYMMAVYKRDYRPDIKLFPMTVVHPKKPYQAIFSQSVLDKIYDLTGIQFEKLDAFYPEYTEHFDFVKEQSTARETWLVQKKIDHYFIGETMNPPIEVEKEFIFTGGGRDQSRDGPILDRPNMLKVRVFRNIDKKGVAELYAKFDVLDSLFPITRSCEKHTTDFKSHCDVCWFCKERFWGFGRYI